MSEYRVDFSILRRDDGEEDFTEYASGSTPASGTILEAGFDAYAAIQNDEWDEA